MKMIWIKSTLIFVLFSSINIACKQEEAIQSIKSGVPKFFDLKGYFEGEMQKLSSKNKFTKTVTVNGKSEAQIIDTLDFRKELSFFAAADISRPAWSDKYVVDTMFNKEKEVVQLHFKRLEKMEA